MPYDHPRVLRVDVPENRGGAQSHPRQHFAHPFIVADWCEGRDLPLLKSPTHFPIPYMIRLSPTSHSF